jgi:anthranilate phosphoribosyltransferase
LNPRQFGLPVHELNTIQVQNAADSKVMILDVLNGKTGPQRDIVLLNAGAAIYVAGMADSHQLGIAVAAKVLDSGAALQKLEQLRVMSNNL